MKCNCVENVIKQIEENGFENVSPPIELLTGRLYLTFTGNKQEQKKQRDIPVLLSKCPFCGKPCETETQNANP